MSKSLLDGAARSDSFEEVFDDDAPPKEGASIQRIRANSSIMKLRKLLVANRGEIREWWLFPLFFSPKTQDWSINSPANTCQLFVYAIDHREMI